MSSQKLDYMRVYILEAPAVVFGECWDSGSILCPAPWVKHQVLPQLRLGSSGSSDLIPGPGAPCASGAAKNENKYISKFWRWGQESFIGDGMFPTASQCKAQPPLVFPLTDQWVQKLSAWFIHYRVPIRISPKTFNSCWMITA